MKIKFWGVRGSIPTPATSGEIRKKIKKVLRGAADVDLGDKKAVDAYVDSLPAFQAGVAGGNSSCVELRAGNDLFIFDAGTGIRELGLELMKSEFGNGEGVARIFLGHTHWDHLMGFPFFTPAYIPGNHLAFYGCHDNLEQRIRNQHVPEHFPVPLHAMLSEKEFVQLKPDRPFSFGETTVTPFLMHHPGDSFGYRVECGGRIFVYASDTEFKSTKEKDTLHLKDADVVVLDTMYTFEEALAKTDWGHCSPFIGVDIALAENVKKLVFFHHEPTYTDLKLEQMLKKTTQYKEKMSPGSPLELILAYEGLEIELAG